MKSKIRTQLIFPSGVHKLVTQTNKIKPIHLFIEVRKDAVKGLNNSLVKDSWVATDEQELSMAAKALKFSWRERKGIMLKMKMVYDQEKNLPQLKWLAGCFNCGINFQKMVKKNGVLQFPKGENGSKEKPAKILFADPYCVAFFTNKPSF